MARPKSEKIRRTSPNRFDDRKGPKSRKAPPQPKHKQVEESRNAESRESAENAEPVVALELQQRCLNLFRDAFEPGQNGEDAATLQEVKGHLFNRDFGTAFGREEYLRVYAARWSPSRALGYLEIFAGLEEELKGRSQFDVDSKIVCLGGGAGAELVGLGGWLSLREQDGRGRAGGKREEGLKATFVDVADWSSVVSALGACLVQVPAISQFAPAAKKEANAAMLSKGSLETIFRKLDLLELEDAGMVELVGEADVVTLMFTLNELYTASLPKTQRMLRQLTSAMRPGAVLLVVDSPGSYSTVSINGAEKKYPMQWLLDYSLLGPPPKKAAEGEEESEKTEEVVKSDAKWQKLVSDASRWFRLAGALQYPIELENMRYQIHLYERLGGDRKKAG